MEINLKRVFFIYFFIYRDQIWLSERIIIYERKIISLNIENVVRLAMQSLTARIAVPGCVQISILDYQIRFIAAVVFSCFNTQAIDVCWGKIALIIFHPYVINRDLPLNAQSAGLLNTHLLFKSAQTQTSSFRLAHG